MTATLEQLIDALRNELQQYGEMLALLEAQQKAVSQREAGAVLTSIPEIESQGNAIQDARRARETCQRQLAWALGQPDSLAFQELLPLLPDEYRPLVGALVDEINELLARVRQFAERNRSLLRRSLELMDRFLAAFSAPSGGVVPAPGEPSPRPVSAFV